MRVTEKLRVVDADTLLSTPLEKTAFVVDGLIPMGVTLLGGSSKIGKSWLMLWLGLQVARGDPLWGMATHRCDVLYLCLEDTMGRIQNRLYRLTDEAPAGLRFATACGKLGSGLEAQILQALRDYPETRLIIIDTLQKARDSRSAAGKNGLYSADYDDMSALKDLADSQSRTAVTPSTSSPAPQASPGRRTPTWCSSACAAPTPPLFWSPGGMWTISSCTCALRI